MRKTLTVDILRILNCYFKEQWAKIIDLPLAERPITFVVHETRKRD